MIRSSTHDAFTGGHSDGNLNTVRKEDGWRPSSSGYGYKDHDDKKKQDDGPAKEAAEDGCVGSIVGVVLVAALSRGKGRGGRRRRIARIMMAEEFMDEEDAKSFEGTVGGRLYYRHGGGAATAAGDQTGDNYDQKTILTCELDAALSPSSSSSERDPMARRLLRALGWRGDPSRGGGGRDGWGGGGIVSGVRSKVLG